MWAQTTFWVLQTALLFNVTLTNASLFENNCQLKVETPWLTEASAIARRCTGKRKSQVVCFPAQEQQVRLIH